MKSKIIFLIASTQVLWMVNAYRNCPAEITSQQSCSDFCLQKDSTGQLKYICQMYNKLLRTYDLIAPNVDLITQQVAIRADVAARGMLLTV